MPKLYERIFELALNRSFFFPSNEPYGSVSGFYDYGPVGKLIKNNIENLWRKQFIRMESAHEVETALITPEIVLKASGHVDSFADPIVECTRCKTRYRADHFIEKQIPDFRWDGKLTSIDETIKKHTLRCNCKGELGPAHFFNLMFKTGIGGEQAPAYGRPETAQGIFTAFLRIFRNHGAKLPLLVAQIGKSFRNEISPRRSLVRMREFTQMELEYFFNPNTGTIDGFETVAQEKIRVSVHGAIQWKPASQLLKEKIVPDEIFAYFLVKEWKFYTQCGLDENRMYFRVLGAEERPHYSQANIDLEVETSHGIIEVNGNAYRTDFDLSQHATFSKQDLSVFVEEEKKRIVPHVFEASLGVDRLFFCILEHTFREKTKEKDWEWFQFPSIIAPYECAIFPLMKKDGLAEKAHAVYDLLKKEHTILYQESGSIGKRYARADEIGIPIAATVDYDTLKDEQVTIRYRDTGKQVRIDIDKIGDIGTALAQGEQWDELVKRYKLKYI